MTASDRARRRAAALGLALALVLVGRSPAARADGARPTERSKRAAQQHLDRGNDLFTHDQFAGALAEFQTAFDLYPSPKLHFNLGQCERALGHADAAAAHFETFLAATPDVAPELRAEAQRYLDEARPSAAPASPEAPPPPAIPAPAAVMTASRPPPHEPPLVAAPAAPPPARPLYTRWWFWAAAGAVVIGATVTAIALTRPTERCPPEFQTCL